MGIINPLYLLGLLLIPMRQGIKEPIKEQDNTISVNIEPTLNEKNTMMKICIMLSINLSFFKAFKIPKAKTKWKIKNQTHMFSAKVEAFVGK